jgi:hypothetical protein
MLRHPIHFNIFALAFCLLIGCAPPDNPDLSFSVASDAATDWTEAPVTLDWSTVASQIGDGEHAIVRLSPGGLEVPSQSDDLNGDGTPDEVFFMLDLAAGRDVLMNVGPSPTPPEYRKRTQALVAVRQGGRFAENGLYVDGSDFTPVDHVIIPAEQEQDSDWAMFEGPVWESDLVGFRYYLDDRFRTDIFGKRVPEPVLHNVKGDYHAISEWGADILKVGTSLGLGSPAVVTDQGLAIVDNAESRSVEVVTSGPLRSIIRSTHFGFKVAGQSADLVSELEIRAGQRWTEQRLSIIGLPASTRLATGIVRHPDAAELHSGEVDGVLFMYTWGIQTDQGHGLGMAVLVKNELDPIIDDTDAESHVVTFETIDGVGRYRYLSAWELESDPIPDRAAFESVVRRVASEWSSTITVTKK